MNSPLVGLPMVYSRYIYLTINDFIAEERQPLVWRLMIGWVIAAISIHIATLNAIKNKHAVVRYLGLVFMIALWSSIAHTFVYSATFWSVGRAHWGIYGYTEIVLIASIMWSSGQVIFTRDIPWVEKRTSLEYVSDGNGGGHYVVTEWVV